MQDSVYLRTENCFPYTLRKRRCGALGMWLSLKSNTVTAISLRNKSSVLLCDY